MQYYNTEYPFAFIEGQTRYDIPFSIKLDPEPLTDDKREFFRISYNQPYLGDTEYYNFTINKETGEADVYSTMVYKLAGDDTTLRFEMSIIICSSEPFSVKIVEGVKWVDLNYRAMSSSTINNESTYTYDGKKVYYYYTDNILVSYGKNSIGSNIYDWHSSTELNANDWTVYYNTAEKYFAWLITYGEKPYTNDPYNRPPDTGGAPAAQGGE